MMEVKVYNQQGEQTGTMALPDAVFGLKWNADLVHQAVTSQQANQRAGTAHTKKRSEVRGGGRKPWRQKGTGRARHGSIRSPIWKGGGVAHGPTTEKNYKKKLNKKMAKKALYTALSAKVRDQEIIILNDLAFFAPKTKFAAQMFQKLTAIPGFSRMTKTSSVLVALPTGDIAARRALRNLPFVHTDEARNLNTYGVMRYKYILFPQKSLEAMGRSKQS
ncbi:MAG: 50S ribosomal protein L4 [Candidatus Sungbacteria bacterium]|nr:50S ribosomal protein L4 [Candidatus Sungbacteria bacterium]